MKLDRNRYLESRSLKPSLLLYAILAVNVVLGIIVWAFPQDGISLWGSEKIKFVTIGDLHSDSDSDKVDVNLDTVLQGVLPRDKLVTESNIDSSKKNSDTLQNRLSSKRKLQLPPNNPNALKSLRRGLLAQSKRKVVRILHYGDSQLEGDRISDYFRNKMQKKYGGTGPGILLPKEPAAASRRAVHVTESNNFKKDAIYVKGASVRDNKYGIGAAMFSISGGTSRFQKWSEQEPSEAIYSGGSQAKAYWKIKTGNSGYDLAQQYTQARLLYTNDEAFRVELLSDTTTKVFDIEPELGLGIQKWNVRTKKQLKLTFSKGAFPSIYGLALDGNTGVAVDNFAMRGSSAIGFSKMNRAFYARQLKDMNVCAIILQYGINVVPNVRSDYEYYYKILVKQLNSIKAASPGTSIIVIGPSDMSRKRGGTMVSFSNIPLIRNAMKRAAFETGCCFWDLYEVMGGNNSMKAWVKKGLAQKDYTHFSYKGAKYVGQMLYDAIVEEIEE